MVEPILFIVIHISETIFFSVMLESVSAFWFIRKDFANVFILRKLPAKSAPMYIRALKVSRHCPRQFTRKIGTFLGMLISTCRRDAKERVT